jgi:predicted RNA-binding Zn-ribbon protein involved in translation (DUF1610 family)
MRRMITRCPNCGVTLRKYKTPVVLFSPSAALGRMSPLLAPLKVGIVVQPYSCPVCGLVQLFEANRASSGFARIGRMFSTRPRNVRKIGRRRQVA